MVWKLRHRLSVTVAFLVVALTSLALAQSSIQAGLEYDSKGKPVAIIVSGKSGENSETYLGVSMYPTGISDPLTQGTHSYESIPANSTFAKRFPVGGISGGTYEVGWWAVKVPKAQALDQSNFFVKKWGFVFDGQKAYLSGWIMPHSTTK